MINKYIFNRQTFILRSLVITFYKIKSLSEILIHKFGVFDNLSINKENNKQINNIYHRAKNSNML